MEQSPPRLRVGVIGVGRAGSVLGAALDRAGHRVVAAYAVSDTSRLRAEALLPGVRLVTPAEVMQESQLVLLTVPDDVLPGLVQGLASTEAVVPGQFVMHASGRYGIGVLEPATAAGALPLALHPAMTLTGTSVDVQRLSGCPFGVTAPDVLRPVAEALVVEMGGEPVWVPEEARTMYHAGLAHASNHLITLITSSVELLRSAGIESPERLIDPLVHASLDNALERGVDALTGPVVRGDAGTVAAHVRAIDAASPEIGKAYRAMARLTADRALRSGRLQAQAAEAMLDALHEQDPL